MANASGPPSAYALTRREGAKIALLFGILGGVTVASLALSFYLGQAYPVLGGLGVVCFILGVRHGFDADHIAAIDNTTRKLLHQGKRPLTVGTWFSLGHSTIVTGMLVALVVATGFIAGNIAGFRAVGQVVGTLISGTFLWIIGLINLVIVVGLYRILQDLRKGRIRSADLDETLDRRGFLNRIFRRAFQFVNEPWQIYPIGILFGLGFDTATEVAFLAIGTTIANEVGHPPLWTVLTLPLLFTCGMVLSDTADGVSMRYAYGWAFSRPLRKLYYNLTLTIISILVAFLVGSVEFLQVASQELGWRGPFWSALQAVDFAELGLAIVAVFLAAWGVSMAIYRWLRLDEEEAALEGPPGPPEWEPSTSTSSIA